MPDTSLTALAEEATSENDLLRLAELMVWAESQSEPFSYVRDALQGSAYIQWVEAASPTAILALIARVRKAEAALSVERIEESLSGLAVEDEPVIGWMARFEDGGVSNVPAGMLAAALLATLKKTK